MKKNQYEWELSALKSYVSVPKCEDKPALSGRVIRIPLSVIESNPLQTRRFFDEVAILALADSIRRYGLLQPILVRRKGKTGGGGVRYVCVVGERRLRAHKMLGRDEISCLVLPSWLDSADELSLVENSLRKDLNMFEFGSALSDLCHRNSITRDEIATRVSASKNDVSHKISLLDLTPEEQSFVLSKNLSEAHVLALLKIEDVQLRQKVAKLICERRYDVKRAEDYIETLLSDEERFVSTFDDDGDVTSFANGVDCLLRLLYKKGFAVSCERFDRQDETQFLIRIPKR